MAMKPTYCVFNKTTESFLGLNISCADTSWARLRGLLGKPKMSSDEGLWVVPSRGIHTIGMLVPIDVVYLDAGHRVVHLVEHLGSFRVGPICWKSSSVLELPPHAIYASHTRVGDELLICLPEQMATYLKNTNPAGEQPSPGKAAG